MNFKALVSLVMLVLAPTLFAANPPTPITGEPPAKQLGLTARDAVEVCDPSGERQYLARLVCPDGQHPEFNRLGGSDERTPLPPDMSEEASERYLADMLTPRVLKPGEPDYHITDAYDVSCGSEKVVIYMDMYHCSQPAPTDPPVGFSIIN